MQKIFFPVTLTPHDLICRVILPLDSISVTVTVTECHSILQHNSVNLCSMLFFCVLVPYIIMYHGKKHDTQIVLRINSELIEHRENI